MAEYKVRLGVEVKTVDIQKQINDAESKLNKIKLNIDGQHLSKQVNSVLTQINKTNKGTKAPIMSIDTTSLESSLKDVNNLIKEVKNSIGTLDSKSGMKSLLASINQISSALEKVSAQFDSITADLKSISSKDFNLNFGIKVGGSNQIQRNAMYENKARNETLPQLKEQAAELENYFKAYYKVQEGYQAVQKLIQGSNVRNGRVSLYDMLPKLYNTKAPLSQQMDAWKDYISVIKEASNIKGFDISSVTSKFSKSADDLVKDAQDIQTGVNETEESFEKLRQIFGGSNVNVEGISAQLESIVDNLNAIKVAIQELSSGVSINDLSQDFKELSETLKQLMSNVTLVQNTLNGGFSGAGSSISDAIQNIKVADINLTTMRGHVDQLKTVLGQIGFNNSSIDVITKDIDKLGISVTNVTTKLNKDGSINLTVKGIDQMERAVTVMKTIDKVGNIKNLGTSISQSFNETENAYKRLIDIVKEMSNIKVKIAGLDADKNSAEINELTAQLNKLESEYNDLYAITGKNLSNGQFTKLCQEITDGANKIRQAESRMSDTSAIKTQENAYKELVSILKQIDSLEINVTKLKGQGASNNEIAEIEAQLRNLRNTYREIEHSMNKPLSSSQLDDLYNQVAKTQNRIDKLNASILDKKIQRADSIISSSSISKVENQYSKVYSSLNKLKSSSQEVKIAFDNLNNAYSKLSSARNSYKSVMSDYTSSDNKKLKSIDKLISANKEYENSLATVNNLIAKNTRAQKDSVDASYLKQKSDKLSYDMDRWLRDNSLAANEFGDSIKNLKIQLKTCDDVDFNNIRAEFEKIKNEAINTGKVGKTFGDRIKAQFQKYSSYLSVASAFMYVSQVMRDMYQQVVAIDTKMTELKKVTDETSKSYDQFLSNAASRAADIGTTIDGLVSSTADFARLGYDFEDAQGLAEVANIYTVVGDEIESVDTATESLISTMAAFKDETKGISNVDFAMDIVDKFNEVSNNFAISSGGIGTALEKSASSLKAANNTIDESIALITAANTVTQDPDVVGNAFKTISMRIRGAKTELEDMGEDADGMVESTAKLREEIMALSGVDIMKDNKTFKSTYQILDELSQKWKDLTDIQQAKCLPVYTEMCS